LDQALFKAEWLQDVGVRVDADAAKRRGFGVAVSAPQPIGWFRAERRGFARPPLNSHDIFSFGRAIILVVGGQRKGAVGIGITARFFGILGIVANVVENHQSAFRWLAVGVQYSTANRVNLLAACTTRTEKAGSGRKGEKSDRTNNLAVWAACNAHGTGTCDL